MINRNSITATLFRQINNYWSEYDKSIIIKYIPKAIERIESNFKAIHSERFNKNGEIVFTPMHSVQWSIFLYNLSNILSTGGYYAEADIVYYLNKILHSVDWYHQVDLPIHFMAEHPLGSILGRAKYDDFLFVYQGTTVGGNPQGKTIIYPTIGCNVILCANTTILGDTKIGNNVIVSACTYLINEIIPDNSIVFGKSPNIEIKYFSAEEMQYRMKGLFDWG